MRQRLHMRWAALSPRRRRLLQSSIAASLWACSWGSTMLGCGTGEVRELPGEVRLVVWNRSEFELLDLYVTPGLSYAGATNLLTAPLPNETRFDFVFTNRSYVTVVRRRVQAGERIAFTTARSLELDQDGFTLVVFQESFRLLDPDSSANGRHAGDPRPFGFFEQ